MVTFLLLGRESPYGHQYSRLQTSWLLGQELTAFPVPAFPILAAHPEVRATGNPLQPAGTEHHKLFLLWSGQSAPQPAAARRQLGRDAAAASLYVPVSSFGQNHVRGRQFRE